MKCQTLVLWRVFDEYQIIDMQSGKEKMSNMASAAKEKAEVYKAKAEEKVVIHVHQYISNKRR